VLGTLEAITFFKLLPKKAELGAKTPAPDAFRFNCNAIVK